ncbi:MAG: hypothetical protein IKG82_00445 [Oscillospiraceae bacterium]|nr:hypothetical protein [Oscillospiraceae bacterium]
MSREMQAVVFLNLLCCYLKANPDCLAEVSNPGKVSAQSPLLGYYDDTYYYIRPEMMIPMFRAITYQNYHANMMLILRELFAADFIKVHWILCGEVRYRPQKRIGGTRKRYITFYRKQLDSYMDRQLIKEAGHEKG